VIQQAILRAIQQVFLGAIQQVFLGAIQKHGLIAQPFRRTSSGA